MNFGEDLKVFTKYDVLVQNFKIYPLIYKKMIKFKTDSLEIGIISVSFQEECVLDGMFN